MVTTRGVWTLDEAVQNRWDLYQLNVDFRAYWPVTSETRFPVLHEEEARPTPPGPYCVYERTPTGASMGMTSSDIDNSAAERRLDTYLVQFRIHAKDTATSPAKTICIALAKKVAEAFDDLTALDISPDSHVQTQREPDITAVEGDKEYSFTLQYLITIDTEYDISPLHSP